MIMTLVGRPGNWTAYVGLGHTLAVTKHNKDYGSKAWDWKEIADISIPFRVYDAADGTSAIPVTPLVLVGRAGAYVGYYDMTRPAAVAAHNAAYGADLWAVKIIEADAPFWCYDAEAM